MNEQTYYIYQNLQNRPDATRHTFTHFVTLHRTNEKTATHGLFHKKYVSLRPQTNHNKIMFNEIDIKQITEHGITP